MLAVVLGVAFECFFGLQLFEDDLWDAGGRRPYGDVFRSVFMKDVSGDVFEKRHRGLLYLGVVFAYCSSGLVRVGLGWVELGWNSAGVRD